MPSTLRPSALLVLLSVCLFSSSLRAQSSAEAEPAEREPSISERLCAEGLVPLLDCADTGSMSKAIYPARKPGWRDEACEAGVVPRAWCLDGPPVPAELAREVEPAEPDAKTELRANCDAGLLPLRFCPKGESEKSSDGDGS